MAKKAKKAATSKKAKKTAKAKKAKTAKKTAAGSAERTVERKAGKPVTADQLAAAAAATGPSDEELDLRDRLKAGPRRQAGPPLSDDTPHAAAMTALQNEVVPKPTDPEDEP